MPAHKDVDFDFTGIAESERWIEKMVDEAPHALSAFLAELGLFGERETKLRTRVDTGTARASIGHFTPEDMTSKASSKDAETAKNAAYFDEPHPGHLEVSWGSRVVYIPVLNYRLGDLMFEHGMQAAISFAPALVWQYLKALPS